MYQKIQLNHKQLINLGSDILANFILAQTACLFQSLALVCNIDSIIVKVSCNKYSLEMMMPIKKQFQPPLPQISQLIELQNFTIVKPTIREGLVKKDKGFFASWKSKTLSFLFVPDEKLVCYILDGVKVQETLNLVSAKVSKKCTEVEDKICFGVLTPNDQKYLISLNSNRECLKIFNQILSARKILNMSFFKSYRDVSSKKRMASEQEKEQSIELLIEENTNQLSRKISIQDRVKENQEKKGQKPMKESCSKLFSRQSEFSKTNTLFQHISKDSNQLAEQFIELEKFKGFKLYKQFPNGSLYQNQEKMTKAKIQIYSPESAKEVFHLFYQFDLWNSLVKKFKKISRLSEGVYKFYLQFHKKGCFSASKCCEVLLSLSKWDDEYYITMNTTSEKPQYLDGKDWLVFTSCAKIKTTLNNPRQKQVYVCLSSAQSNNIVKEFGHQLKSFPEFVKSKPKGPQKDLQVRNVSDNK